MQRNSLLLLTNFTNSDDAHLIKRIKNFARRLNQMQNNNIGIQNVAISFYLPDLKKKLQFTF